MTILTSSVERLLLKIKGQKRSVVSKSFRTCIYSIGYSMNCTTLIDFGEKTLTIIIDSLIFYMDDNKLLIKNTPNSFYHHGIK